MKTKLIVLSVFLVTATGCGTTVQVPTSNSCASCEEITQEEFAVLLPICNDPNGTVVPNAFALFGGSFSFPVGSYSFAQYSSTGDETGTCTLEVMDTTITMLFTPRH